MTKAYEAMGMHREALESYQTYISIRDTLLNEEKEKEIQDITEKFTDSVDKMTSTKEAELMSL